MTSGPYFLAAGNPAVAGASWFLTITTQILADHSFVANSFFFLSGSGVGDMSGIRARKYLKARINNERACLPEAQGVF
jgi:hypothetical protein